MDTLVWKNLPGFGAGAASVEIVCRQSALEHIAARHVGIRAEPWRQVLPGGEDVQELIDWAVAAAKGDSAAPTDACNNLADFIESQVRCSLGKPLVVRYRATLYGEGGQQMIWKLVCPEGVVAVVAEENGKNFLRTCYFPRLTVVKEYNDTSAPNQHGAARTLRWYYAVQDVLLTHTEHHKIRHNRAFFKISPATHLKESEENTPETYKSGYDASRDQIQLHTEETWGFQNGESVSSKLFGYDWDGNKVTVKRSAPPRRAVQKRIRW